MLKVMTMNLNYYVTKHGPWEDRRELVAEAMRTFEPDVIAFQAVRQEPGVLEGKDQAAQLAAMLPQYRYHHYQVAAAFEDGHQEGSALLSRLPLKEVSYQELTLIPGLDDPNQRLILYAQVDTQGGPLHIFNAHFSWVTEQARLNIEEALLYTAQFEGPALLMGDLNTPADSQLLERLKTAGWVDAWETECPDEAGLTFEAGDPTLRIDYIWMNAEAADALEEIAILATGPSESGSHASDHYALAARLNLELLTKGAA